MERTYTAPRLDKLGVRPGLRIAVLGIADEAFVRELLDRVPDVFIGDGDPEPGTEVVFLAADSADELARLEDLERVIARDGAIWVVSRKGRAATIRDVDVIAAAKATGLVDNKVVGFSPTHTALRLVVPRTRR